ncbi:MAG: TIGR01777 family oxidoreductase [Candidatus Kapabacteria bacterium]|nr:TIGR01777 family oxidoreductase [Ignavibacteriota bacterium]MCW5883729.1 TIGR01777 family oxidoreductase [Candidatus Kapabacteria bacterium]
MKKVIISGGTGMIGRHLTERLVNSGYEVVILTRSPKRYNSTEKIRYDKLDLDDIDYTARLINGSYSVINLAGAGVADKRWTDEYKKEIYDSRINITSHLTEAINRAEKKPKSFITASAIGIYGDRGEETLTESSAAANTFLAKVCVDWEKESDKCSDLVRLVKARIGVVLAKEGGAYPQMITPFKFFVGGPIGSGKQWLSWIHIDDICGMFMWCIENPDVVGVYNFTAPNPVTMNDFAGSLGKSVSRPSLFKVPEFILKLILGESAAVVLSSQKVLPESAISTGYNYKYSILDSALASLV